MSEATTTESTKSKKRGPDWTSSDKKMAIWIEKAPGRQPRAKIAVQQDGAKVYLTAYPNTRGIELAAADIGAILEDKAIYSEQLLPKPQAGKEQKPYKGFICLKDIQEKPWNTNAAKTDNVVNFALVLPITYPDSGKIRGYVYDKKAVFAHVKSGEHHVGDLTPRDVVKLIDQPGTTIQFGQGEAAYTVRLDRFDPPAEGFDNEIARLSVTRGEAHELIENQEETETASAGQSV